MIRIYGINGDLTSVDSEYLMDVLVVVFVMACNVYDFFVQLVICRSYSGRPCTNYTLEKANSLYFHPNPENTGSVSRNWLLPTVNYRLVILQEQLAADRLINYPTGNVI